MALPDGWEILNHTQTIRYCCGDMLTLDQFYVRTPSGIRKIELGGPFAELGPLGAVEVLICSAARCPGLPFGSPVDIPEDAALSPFLRALYPWIAPQEPAMETLS